MLKLVWNTPFLKEEIEPWRIFWFLNLSSGTVSLEKMLFSSFHNIFRDIPTPVHRPSEYSSSEAYMHI